MLLTTYDVQVFHSPTGKVVPVKRNYCQILGDMQFFPPTGWTSGTKPWLMIFSVLFDEAPETHGCVHRWSCQGTGAAVGNCWESRREGDLDNWELSSSPGRVHCEGWECGQAAVCPRRGCQSLPSARLLRDTGLCMYWTSLRNLFAKGCSPRKADVIQCRRKREHKGPLLFSKRKRRLSCEVRCVWKWEGREEALD